MPNNTDDHVCYTGAYMTHCEHANECPVLCSCAPTCYCRQTGNTCSTTRDSGLAIPGHRVDALPERAVDVVAEQLHKVMLESVPSVDDFALCLGPGLHQDAVLLVKNAVRQVTYDDSQTGKRYLVQTTVKLIALRGA